MATPKYNPNDVCMQIDTVGSEIQVTHSIKKACVHYHVWLLGMERHKCLLKNEISYLKACAFALLKAHHDGDAENGIVRDDRRDLEEIKQVMVSTWVDRT